MYSNKLIDSIKDQVVSLCVEIQESKCSSFNGFLAGSDFLYGVSVSGVVIQQFRIQDIH